MHIVPYSPGNSKLIFGKYVRISFCFPLSLANFSISSYNNYNPILQCSMNLWKP